MTIEDYVDQLKKGKFSEIEDMDELRASHEVRVIAAGEGNKKQKQKLYNCFVYEVDHSGSIYVLFGGQWFAVDRDFYGSVERDFKSLLPNASFVASTSAENERELIAELNGHKNLLNLDQVKLSPANAKGANLEPCDFLSKDKQFIHLKDGHSSAPISHLWNQGIVSAEAFVLDEKFRIDLRREIKKREKKFKKAGFDGVIPDGRSKPTPVDYTVIFGIMRERYQKSGLLGLPFFSKVSLRTAAERIRLMGFSIEVHLIERT